MAINLAGLGIIYNDLSTLNQQYFQLRAVPGSLTLVVVGGVIQKPDTYTIDRSLLILNQALAADVWVFVLSGQGGTFVPQSYVDNAVSPKADQITVDNQLAGKIDKTGGDFTGHITVQEPVNPMNPVTKQMWDTLPDSASLETIQTLLAGKADAEAVALELLGKVNASEKGSSGGVAELDVNSDIIPYQLPGVVFNDDKSFSKFGPLAVGAGQGRWYPRFTGIIKGIIGYVELASAGDDIVVDINKTYTDPGDGLVKTVSMFSDPTNRLIIAAGQNYGEFTFTVPPTFTRGDSITVELERVGSVETGSNLTLQMEYEYTPGA